MRWQGVIEASGAMSKKPGGSDCDASVVGESPKRRTCGLGVLQRDK